MLQGQIIRGALLGGFTLTQVDGDEVYGFHKLGLSGGAAAIIPFGEKWSISLETTYIQKGAYQSPQYNDSLSFEYKIKLDYAEVPVMIHYTDKDVVTAGLGFAWGRLVNVQEWEHGKRVSGTTLLGGPYKRDDYSFLADIRFRLRGRIHFNARYAYSLGKIRSREFTVGTQRFIREQYNNVIAFRLIYIFNEDLPLQNRRKE
jgi:hypothetical protein